MLADLIRRARTLQHRSGEVTVDEALRMVLQTEDDFALLLENQTLLKAVTSRDARSQNVGALLRSLCERARDEAETYEMFCKEFQGNQREAQIFWALHRDLFKHWQHGARREPDANFVSEVEPKGIAIVFASHLPSAGSDNKWMTLRPTLRQRRL